MYSVDALLRRTEGAPDGSFCIALLTCSAVARWSAAERARCLLACWRAVSGPGRRSRGRASVHPVRRDPQSTVVVMGECGRVWAASGVMRRDEPGWSAGTASLAAGVTDCGCGWWLWLCWDRARPWFVGGSWHALW